MQILRTDFRRDQLLQLLLSLLVNSSGASKGLWISKISHIQKLSRLASNENNNEQQFFVEASTLNTAKSQQSQSTTLVDIGHNNDTSVNINVHDFPSSIIHYCFVTKQSLLISDIKQHPQFNHDKYFHQSAQSSVSTSSPSPLPSPSPSASLSSLSQSGSLLCFPLISNDSVTSILYFESDFCFDFFNYDRLMISRLLIQQSLMLLENEHLVQQLAINTSNLESKVAQRTRELEEATQRANEANKLKSAFLANMSHEIRTPMNGVIGGTSLILEGAVNLTADQREIVHIIRTSGEVMLTLINDILDLSKIEAGRVELQQTPFSFRSCVEGALDVLAEKAAAKNLDLMYSASLATPDTIVGDATRLRQIIINLVGNGVKFSSKGQVLLKVDAKECEPPPNNNSINNANETNLPKLQTSPTSTFSPLVTSRATTATSTPSSALRRTSLQSEKYYEFHVQVIDSGLGISLSSQQQLFQSFSQVHSMSDAAKYGGTGLGLSISKQLCELMSGRMWCESDIGKGSTFHFTFKIRGTFDNSPPCLHSNHADLTGKKLLIVNNNIYTAKMIGTIANDWGIDILIAQTMKQFQSLINKNHFNFVLIDYLFNDKNDNNNNNNSYNHGENENENILISDQELYNQSNSDESEDTSMDGTSPLTSSPLTTQTTESPLVNNMIISNSPILSGLDVAHQIRGNFPAGSPSIILLCGLSQRQRSMRSVIDAFLSKPMKPSKFFAALLNLSRGKPSIIVNVQPTIANLFPPPDMKESNRVLTPTLSALSQSLQATSVISNNDNNSNNNDPSPMRLSSRASVEHRAVPFKPSSSVNDSSLTINASSNNSNNSFPNPNNISPPSLAKAVKRKREHEINLVKQNLLTGNEINNSPAPSASLISSTSAAASQSNSLLSTLISPFTTTTNDENNNTSNNNDFNSNTNTSIRPSSSSSVTLPVDETSTIALKYPMRILVAEDNAINQKVIAKMLERLGYNSSVVDVVENGQLAWEACVKEIQQNSTSSLMMTDENTNEIISLQENDKKQETSTSSFDSSSINQLSTAGYQCILMDVFM